MYEPAYNTIPTGVTVQILHACQLADRRWISSEEETEELLFVGECRVQRKCRSDPLPPSWTPTTGGRRSSPRRRGSSGGRLTTRWRPELSRRRVGCPAARRGPSSARLCRSSARTTSLPLARRRGKRWEVRTVADVSHELWSVKDENILELNPDRN